ncbi:TK1 [Bugula neritina]|uniref:Thymidine kinase n=1 Tax=Bugula neritina TaxID=10212 RepID=A0A7J7J0K1_BUGNE|nr:TK1 [Bugula neritina]
MNSSTSNSKCSTNNHVTFTISFTLIKGSMASEEADHSQGQIQIIFGPMFSGKTTELIRRMRRYSIANYDCLLVKNIKDTRYDKDGLATHDLQVENVLPIVSAAKLFDVDKKIVLESEVIGIDEGQFYPDVVSFSEEMANRGKVVIVAALDGTFERRGFHDILDLVPLAESVIKLNAVCMQCFREASFTKRTSAETEVEVLGGSEKYLSVCRTCHQNSSKKPSPRKSKQYQRKYGSEHVVDLTGRLDN